MTTAASTTSRRSAQELSRLCVAEMKARLAEAGLVQIAIGSERVPFLRIIEGHLIQRCADALDSGPPARGLKRAKQWLRQRLYRTRNLMLPPGPRRFSSKGAGTKRILAMPHNAAQLESAQSIAEADEGLELHFVIRDVRELAGARASGVVARAYARPRLDHLIRARAELVLSRRLLARPADVDRETWSRLVRVVLDEAALMLQPTLTTARAMERAIEELSPRVVLVGNPCTPDGAVSALIARQHRLPTITVQHGDIRPENTEWARATFDTLAVWGSYARDVLCELGVDPSRLVVTGAPWTDRLISRHRNTERPRILVALSGAGHSVGMSEHLAHVRRLLAASAERPEYEWRFRLHRKDDPEIYRKLMPAGSSATIVDARSMTTSIYDDLETARMLITVTSASAQDAMMVGVPVMTLSRPAGEPLPAYVEQRATIHVGAQESLATRIAELVERGADEATLTNAKRFVERYFGPLDGQASRRVAALLSSLAGGTE